MTSDTATKLMIVFLILAAFSALAYVVLDRHEPASEQRDFHACDGNRGFLLFTEDGYRCVRNTSR